MGFNCFRNVRIVIPPIQKYDVRDLLLMEITNWFIVLSGARKEKKVHSFFN